MFKKYFNPVVFFLSAFILFFAAGCGEQKRETPEEEEKLNEPVEETEAEDEEIPNITGTWTGKLDAHTSTLRITDQDSLTFEGKISTNFREAVHQEIKGKFNPEERTLTMSDQLQSRFEGTYYAKISEDMKSMTGTFTMKLDNTKLKFNYTKNN